MSSLLQLKRRVQRAHREFGVFFRDQHADLDFRGGDHKDVDALVRQRLEHILRDADKDTPAASL